MRFVIIHFHIFKNAGTSIESALRDHFGERFMTYECGGPNKTFPASRLMPVLERNKEIVAISSHTTTLPLPERTGWTFFPIVFLRHPLDRVLSIYNYEKTQNSSSKGAVLAKKNDLRGYIEARLETPYEHTLRNYQTWMLSRGFIENEVSLQDGDILYETAKIVLADLPFVGLVEHFSESLKRLNQLLVPHLPNLKLKTKHKNRSNFAGLTLSERLSELEDKVGSSLYQRLQEENALDLKLHGLARQLGNIDNEGKATMISGQISQ